MELLHNRKASMTNKSAIWHNIYGRDEKFKCATALYSLSMLSHTYNIVIDSGVGAYGNGKDVVDGLSVTGKKYFSMIMKTVQLPGASTNDSQMVMHTSMSNK